MNAILSNRLPLNNLSREVSRWMDELTNDARGCCEAPVSIWEDESHFFLEFDLPGVNADDVDIKIVEDESSTG